MKRIITIFLVAILVLQVGLCTAFAENLPEGEQGVTIGSEEMPLLAGETGQPEASIKILGLPSCTIEILSEDLTWTKPYEVVISGEDIAVGDGTYTYRLKIRSNKTLTFDNHLEILYQGIGGTYGMHYEIDENDNHIMIVTGVFENIIVSSPLLQKLSATRKGWILSKISEDSYFYQLNLRTADGFTFVNRLRFLFQSKPAGYTIRYKYDLVTDQQKLVISRITEEDPAIVEDLPTEWESESTTEAYKALAAKYTPARAELVKVAAGKRKVAAKWKTQKKVSGYQVRITDTKTGAVVKTVKVRQTKLRALKKMLTKTVKTLTRKKTYKIDVRAYKKAGGYSFKGEWSEAMLVTTK